MAAIITQVGMDRISEAFTTGSLPVLKTVKFGDGKGSTVIANMAMTDITNTVYECGIDMIEYQENTVISVEIPVTVGGFTVREMGVYDDEDNLIAIEGGLDEYKTTFAERPSTLTFRMVLKLSEDEEVDVTFYDDGKYASKEQFNTLIGSLLTYRENVSNDILLYKDSTDEAIVELTTNVNDAISDHETATAQMVSDAIGTVADTIVENKNLAKSGLDAVNARVDTKANVSDTYTRDTVDTLVDNKIATHKEIMDTSIANRTEVVNDKFIEQASTINQTITTEVEKLNATISGVNDTLENSIDDTNLEVAKKANIVDTYTKVDASNLIDSKIEAHKTTMDQSIDSKIEVVDNKLDTYIDASAVELADTVDTITDLISDNKDDVDDSISTINIEIAKKANIVDTYTRDAVDTVVDNKIATHKDAMDASIAVRTEEVNTLITSQTEAFNVKIDNNHTLINSRVDSEVEDLTTIIDTNKSAIEDALVVTNTEVAKKANTVDTYTRSAVDTLVSDSIDDHKTAMDASIAVRSKLVDDALVDQKEEYTTLVSNTNSTLTGIINDNKIEIEDALETTNTEVAKKANITDTYTRTNADLMVDSKISDHKAVMDLINENRDSDIDSRLDSYESTLTTRVDNELSAMDDSLNQHISATTASFKATNDEVAKKANITDTYTRTAVSTLVDNRISTHKAIMDASIATRTKMVDDKFIEEAENTATAISDTESSIRETISDNKDAIEEALSLTNIEVDKKANIVDTYTRTAVATLVDGKIASHKTIMDNAMSARATAVDNRIDSVETTLSDSITSNIEDVNDAIELTKTGLEDDIAKKANILDTYTRTDASSLMDTKIASHKTVMDNSIATKYTTLDNKINSNNTTINTKVDDAVDAITDVISDNKSEIEDALALTNTEVDKKANITDTYTRTATSTLIDSKIASHKTVMDTAISTRTDIVDARMDEYEDTFNTAITTNVDTLNDTISKNKSDIENALTNTNEVVALKANASTTYSKTDVNTLIADEIATHKGIMDTSIALRSTAVDTRIDSLETSINDSIDSNVDTLNATIGQNKTSIENSLSATNLEVAKKANASVTYTKDEVDGIVETETDVVKDSLSTHTTNKSNPHNVTKAQIGLSNVENTSDADKEISSATLLALNAKINLTSIVNNLTTSDANRPLSALQGKVLKGLIDSINDVLYSADTTLDTLEEVVEFIKQNKEFLDSLGMDNIPGLTAALASKVDDTQVLTNVPSGAKFTDTWRGIDDSPVNGQVNESISSNWAYDHTNSSTAHPRDTRNLAVGSTAVAATKLATARSIGGVSFNGTANITLPGVNATGNQNTTGNASTATKLASITTSFSGKYPIVTNVNGVIYSHTGMMYEGSTGILTAPTFKGALDGNAKTATWSDKVDVNGSNTSSVWYDVTWHSGDELFSSVGVEIQGSTNSLRASNLLAKEAVSLGNSSEASIKYNTSTDSLDFVFN